MCRRQWPVRKTLAACTPSTCTKRVCSQRSTCTRQVCSRRSLSLQRHAFKHLWWSKLRTSHRERPVRGQMYSTQSRTQKCHHQMPRLVQEQLRPPPPQLQLRRLPLQRHRRHRALQRQRLPLGHRLQPRKARCCRRRHSLPKRLSSCQSRKQRHLLRTRRRLRSPPSSRLSSCLNRLVLSGHPELRPQEHTWTNGCPRSLHVARCDVESLRFRLLPRLRQSALQEAANPRRLSQRHPPALQEAARHPPALREAGRLQRQGAQLASRQPRRAHRLHPKPPPARYLRALLRRMPTT
mmetsp:Transcript_133995/g.244404  ORF Transcript_133995/g.244404 Transcript_133995/m.244404 type:complete len:294 (-) Transcript_133995:32-913(-)